MFLNNAVGVGDERAAGLANLINGARPDRTEAHFTITIVAHLAGSGVRPVEDLPGFFKKAAITWALMLAEHFQAEFDQILMERTEGRVTHGFVVVMDEVSALQVVATEVDRPNDEDIRRARFHTSPVVTPLPDQRDDTIIIPLVDRTDETADVIKGSLASLGETLNQISEQAEHDRAVARGEHQAGGCTCHDAEGNSLHPSLRGFPKMRNAPVVEDDPQSGE